jgi:Raf kinase inhibitor-like YbhB/YbcL family protein
LPAGLAVTIPDSHLLYLGYLGSADEVTARNRVRSSRAWRIIERMLARLALLVPFVVLAACGSDDNKDIDAPPVGSDGPPIDMPPAGFTLTSQMLTANGSFAADNTCSGTNVSPQLSWVNPPAGTMSFAVVLTDLDVGSGLLHWVIWDIPLATTSLGADVDKLFQPADVPGAKQAISTVDNTTRGYMGPCPPFPNTHNYQFDVYAVDSATLPNVVMDSTASAVLVQIAMHNKGHASLKGSYKQP